MRGLSLFLDRLLHGSLVRSTTLAILGFCASIGILAAAAGALFVAHEERHRIELSLTQLMQTVIRTANIAAFTNDKTLASEVVTGLRRNHFVAAVIIRSSEEILASDGAILPNMSRIECPLRSPFDEGQTVGSITLIPDPAAIASQAARLSIVMALVLGVVVCALAIPVAWVVRRGITKPIKDISDRLHHLDVGSNERLVCPTANESNELGRLVSDVNALISRTSQRETIFQGIVNQAMDAITLFDIERDAFVEFNESAHAELGLTREEFAQLRPSSLLAARHSGSSPTSGSANPGPQFWQGRVYESQCTDKDGNCLDIRVSSRVIFLHGRPHAICTWSNITAQKAAQAELRQHRDHLQERVEERTRDLLKAKEAAERANHTKSEFLSNMSHELRTPMHAILSFARMGVDRAERASPDKLRHYFHSVLISGDRLLILLNNLLDLSKLEAGMMTLDLRDNQLSKLIEGVMGEFGPLAAEKKIALKFLNMTQDDRLSCDGPKIHQVISNLISNGVKFSPAGSTLEVGLTAAQTHWTQPDGKTASAPALTVTVKDQGIGIPETELQSVFDKFVQSSKTRSGAGGTGLGLSIVREIVSLHGGSISASNNPEGGACLAFVLPRNMPEQPVSDCSVALA